MGDVIHERDNNGTTSSASARDICEEFLKLLSRKEVEQPLICQNLCLCAQFWRYQHYLLPRWEWGITKLVCLDLGSFRNTQPNGGPFHHHDNQNQQEPQEQQQQQQKQQHTTYGSTIRDPALRAEFNTRPLSACDALQTMLRHAAAVEVAASLALCSSGRGVEHELVKHYFKRLEGLAEEGEKEQQGKATDKDKKLSELPPMAGYAGNRDLVDVPVWFWGGGYTAEDREALKRAAGVMRVAQLPPVEVVGGDVDEVCELVDGRTLVYTVGLDGAVWREVLRRCEPAAVIGGGCASDFESDDALRNDIDTLLNDYREFKLDQARAPHTIGSSHLYIRRDIVEGAERETIVPPYPVTFPHDYPYEHKNWYLDQLEKHGSGKVVLREETTL